MTGIESPESPGRRDRTFRAAVLGSPVSHSLSPVLHRAGYHAAGLENWDYSRIEVTADELPDLLNQSGPEWRGYSVTMPNKFAALELADDASARAQAIGSANTLVRRGEGWWADNTDVEGIDGCLDDLSLLNPESGGPALKEALVIGGGGTARPAIFALARRGVQRITVLNRTDRSAEWLPLVAATAAVLEWRSWNECVGEFAERADVIVSTVPSSVLEGHEQGLAHAPVVDVIYEPWPTPLTLAAAANGYLTVGGHAMLAHQSYRQFELFTGIEAPRAEMRAELKATLA